MIDIKLSLLLLFTLVTLTEAVPIRDVPQKLDDTYVLLSKRKDFLGEVEIPTPKEELIKQPEPDLGTPPEKLLEELMTYARPNATAEDDGYKLGYSVDEGSLKRFRYEEKTPEGLIVGEFGFHSRSNGVIRGVRYTAEAGVRPKLLYEALLKFLSL